MQYSKAMTAATKIEKIQTAITEGYRALQTLFKALRESGLVTLQVKLNASFAVLKAEAQRLIEGYKPIAEVQGAIAKKQQEVEKVLESLPIDTISNNSVFGARLLTGTAEEKNWLIKKDGDGAGLTFIKDESLLFYETFAGDALRAIALLGTETYVENGVLKSRVSTHYAEKFIQEAQGVGLKINLHQRKRQ